MGLANPLHLAILVLVVVLLFGARRLPELGRSLGSGIREFKGSVHSPDAPSSAALGAGPPATPQPTPQARDADPLVPAHPGS